MPNTGNMGFPICLFAYGFDGLGVAAAITALIILFHFTVGVFLADRKFSFDVILKSPPFYTIIISVLLLYFNIELPVFVENTTFLLLLKWVELNFSSILSLLINVRSSFINSEKGKQKELLIDPLLKPFLGSATFPSNLSLLLASITLNLLS